MEKKLVSFAIPAAASRKRPRAGVSTATTHSAVTADHATLRSIFMSVEEAVQDAQDAAARDEQQQQRPMKKTMLLEDARAKVKRLQVEGNTLAEAGRFRAAMDRWTQAVAIDASNAVIYELLAQALMALGDDFEAVQFGLRAVECDPAWGEAFHTLARCHLNFGELELALDNIKKAEGLMGRTDELAADHCEIVKLLGEQREILRRRDAEAVAVDDVDKLQVISCMKHLSLRGRVG